jgi:hypothetical protein
MSGGRARISIPKPLIVRILPLTGNCSTGMDVHPTITPMKRILLLLAVVAVVRSASAQNSDLGLLTGAAFSKDAGFGMQANYAWQFWESRVGRLYVEAPIIIPVAQETNQINIYITPGIRYHFNLSSRVAVYAAAGMGVGVRANPADASMAYELGLGLDYRLNRRWSVRGDIRDISEGASSIQHLLNPSNWYDDKKSAMIGLGLHF